MVLFFEKETNFKTRFSVWVPWRLDVQKYAGGVITWRRDYCNLAPPFCGAGKSPLILGWVRDKMASIQTSELYISEILVPTTLENNLIQLIAPSIESSIKQ